MNGAGSAASVNVYTALRDTPVSLYVYHRDLLSAYYSRTRPMEEIVEEVRHRSACVTAELEGMGVHYPLVFVQHMEMIGSVRHWFARLEMLYGGGNIGLVWFYHGMPSPAFEVMVKLADACPAGVVGADAAVLFTNAKVHTLQEAEQYLIQGEGA